ncbi:MAG: hypothetical protein Kow00121_54850 [Elainellaceae cyanobacterium]
MSSKPEQDQGNSSEASGRKALPFEPSKSRKQAERKVEGKAAKKSAATATKPSKKVETRKATSSGIPEAVSRRMVKRMAFFCGIPTALGMSTFVVSYLTVSNGLVEVPTYAVLLVSLGFFGLGVLGLSYGALSASWDEESPGSRLGWSEFATNWGRMTGAWKDSRETASGASNKKSRPKKS